jgi:hypothetical protein
MKKRRWGTECIVAPYHFPKNRVLQLFSEKPEKTRGKHPENWEGGAWKTNQRKRERERADQRGLGRRFVMVTTQGMSSNSLSLFSLLTGFPYPKIPSRFLYFALSYLIDCWGKIYGLVCVDDFRLYPLNDLAKIPKNFESLGSWAINENFLYSVCVASNSVFNDTHEITAPFWRTHWLIWLILIHFLVDLCWVYISIQPIGLFSWL